MRFIGYIKKLKKDRLMRRIRPYTALSNDSIYGANFSVDIRQPVQGYNYLKIGSHSIIDGRFIFEKDSGMITVGDRVHIGGSRFISIDRITIGNDVTIAWGCLFYDHNSHAVNWSDRKNDTKQEYQDLMNCGNMIKNKNWSVVKHKPITVCDKAWIGADCTILKGVTIGEGAVVAAGSVVTQNVEPWTVVGGNPARVIKRIDEGESTHA